MKNLLIAVALLSLLSVACKKSNTGNGTGNGSGNTPPPPSGSQLKSTTLVIYDSASGTRADSTIILYGYDGQGRPQSALSRSYVFNPVYPAGQLFSTDTTIATYGTGSISVNEQTWAGLIHGQSAITTIYLHASGSQLADSSLRTTTVYNPSLTVTQEKWIYGYDANGYLIHEDNYLLAGGQPKLEADITNTIAGGNTVSTNSVIYAIPGNAATGVPISMTYTFLNQAAPSFGGTGNGNSFIGFGSTITGHANTDLTKSISINGVLAESLSYTFDSNNNLTMVTARSASGTLISIDHYAY